MPKGEKYKTKNEYRTLQIMFLPLCPSNRYSWIWTRWSKQQNKKIINNFEVTSNKCARLGESCISATSIKVSGFQTIFRFHSNVTGGSLAFMLMLKNERCLTLYENIALARGRESKRLRVEILVPSKDYFLC